MTDEQELLEGDYGDENVEKADDGNEAPPPEKTEPAPITDDDLLKLARERGYDLRKPEKEAKKEDDPPLDDEDLARVGDLKKLREELGRSIAESRVLIDRALSDFDTVQGLSPESRKAVAAEFAALDPESQKRVLEGGFHLTHARALAYNDIVSGKTTARPVATGGAVPRNLPAGVAKEITEMEKAFGMKFTPAQLKEAGIV